MENKIGQAIAAPQPRFADTQTQEIFQTLMRPENIMTALVLATSLLHGKRGGESSGQAIARSMAGTMGFRSALDQSREEQARKNQEAASQQEARRAETENRRKLAEIQAGQLDLGQEQIKVDREQIVQSGRNTAANIAANMLIQDKIAARQAASDATQAALQREIAGMRLKGGTEDIDPMALALEIVKESGGVTPLKEAYAIASSYVRLRRLEREGKITVEENPDARAKAVLDAVGGPSKPKETPAPAIPSVRIPGTPPTAGLGFAAQAPLMGNPDLLQNLIQGVMDQGGPQMPFDQEFYQDLIENLRSLPGVQY